MENPGQPQQSGIMSLPWMELFVPLLSFGGALLAVIFWITGIQTDFRISILGCVLGSWLLAYQAWIRPKKDIVALTTPIYSFIFLAVPIDNFSAVILELLYAASLTILLIRLKFRFGRPGTAPSGGKELAEPLKTYVEQTRGMFIATHPGLAHAAAVVFVRFAEGEYSAAARVSEFETAGQNDTDTARCLIRAFGIVREQATVLDQSLPGPEPFLAFAPEDACVLAKTPNPKFGTTEECEVALENALLLLFAAAWTVSEKDRLHLLACQAFAQKLLAP